MKPADHIGSYVTALTLTGLPYTAGKLMGKAPQPVLRQFEIWGRAGKSGLPRVVRTYWKAITPLGISRPSLPGVPVLELVLYGQISDVDVARDAHQAVAMGAKRAMQIAGKPPVIDPVTDGLVHELGTAIKQFWRLYARTCDKAREQVVGGDLGSAVICVRRNEAQILELIDEIERKARTISASLGKTSTRGVDTVLGELLTPSEYTQPNLESLVIYQAPAGGVPGTPELAQGNATTQPPTDPAVEEAALQGFPNVPTASSVTATPLTPKQATPMQAALERMDATDAAAATFATGRMDPVELNESTAEQAVISAIQHTDDQPAPTAATEDSDTGSGSDPVVPKQAFQPIEEYEHDLQSRGSNAWLGVVFVLLSVAIACGVVWYFLFGPPF